jgi:hypothetical protein
VVGGAKMPAFSRKQSVINILARVEPITLFFRKMPAFSLTTAIQKTKKTANKNPV